MLNLHSFSINLEIKISHTPNISLNPFARATWLLIILEQRSILSDTHASDYVISGKCPMTQTPR